MDNHAFSLNVNRKGQKYNGQQREKNSRVGFNNKNTLSKNINSIEFVVSDPLPQSWDEGTDQILLPCLSAQKGGKNIKAFQQIFKRPDNLRSFRKTHRSALQPWRQKPGRAAEQLPPSPTFWCSCSRWSLQPFLCTSSWIGMRWEEEKN